MTEYQWGLATLPIAIGGLAIAVGLGYLLISVARHLWGKTHYSLMLTVKVAKNRARFRLKGSPPDDRPEYWDAANKFRDALLESPKMHSFAGLGWRVIVVRESRTEVADDSDEEQYVDTDEFFGDKESAA